MNIFRTKDFSLSKTEMHRHLKLWDLILLGIGAMVGTGIFTIQEQLQQHLQDLLLWYLS